MTTILDVLQQSIGDEAISELSKAIGASDTETRSAVAAALPMLMEALSRNTATTKGASGLLSALDRDHDGSVLDDVAGFLTAATRDDGDAILDHVLGGRRASVERGVSHASGIDAQSVGRLLAMLAPIVLGALGRMKSENHLDVSGLQKTLTQWSKTADELAPGALKAVGRLLDADHDGQVLDDVAALGSSLATTFFAQR